MHFLIDIYIKNLNSEKGAFLYQNFYNFLGGHCIIIILNVICNYIILRWYKDEKEI